MIAETGTERRKRSATTLIETQLMFNNETLLKSIVDGHKNSYVTGDSLAELGYIPQPSTTTLCDKNAVKAVEYPDWMVMVTEPPKEGVPVGTLIGKSLRSLFLNHKLEFWETKYSLYL